MAKIKSLDEFIADNLKPVKSTVNGHEDPIVKIDRMFKSAIKKVPQFADELKVNWIKMKEKQLAGEISNLEFQIKEILSRYNIAFLSESEEDAMEIPDNPFNSMSKDIRKWIETVMDNYNIESDHKRIIDAAIKHFEIQNKTEQEKDDFVQLVNLNLE